MVSGSLSLPSRGSFHLSLTVLCAIGHWLIFSLGRWSSLLPTGFLVSCGTLVPAGCLLPSDTGLLPSLDALSNAILLEYPHALRRPSTPHDRSLAVWAPPRSLAATYGIVFTFFSSGYLDVSVPRVPFSRTMDSFVDDGTLLPPGLPIQVPVDLCLLAAPHSFSQLTAPFFGVQCHGIHPAPFVT